MMEEEEEEVLLFLVWEGMRLLTIRFQVTCLDHGVVVEVVVQGLLFN